MTLYRGYVPTVLPADSEHRGYFEEAACGRLVVQRCTSCSLLRGFIGAACPFCQSPDWAWHPVEGTGHIYSYQIVVQAMQPSFKDFTPYPVVLVELDEQQGYPCPGAMDGELVSVRLARNLVCGHNHSLPEREENVVIGARVRACFVPISDNMAIPQFRLGD